MTTPGAAPRDDRAHHAWRVGLSRIGGRLLLFNVLAAIMPVAGILYLDVYEQQLLQAQERAMVREARLVAGALGADASLDAAQATALLTRTVPGDSRVRVYNSTGALVADSARLARRADPPQSAAYGGATPATRDIWLYRLGAWIASWRQGIRTRIAGEAGAPSAPAASETAASPSSGAGPPVEVAAALARRFGTAIRPTPGQRSLTLSVAIPITGPAGSRDVIGVATISQSTYRILQALYAVRLRIFRIVVGTLLLAAAISAVLALTIVRPIRRLRRAALALARGERSMPSSFPGTERRDEVGDLARALEELTRRLQAHVTLLESFAGDVAHEFRNPLASVRTAIDVLQEATDPDERARFLSLVRRDVERLDRLVVGVRDLARIDSAIERDVLEAVDVADLARQLGDHRYGSCGVTVTCEDEPLIVRAHPDRLTQVLENLVDNAVSFSPQPGTVAVSVRHDDTRVVVAVSDRGPGIPDSHRDRIFDRFFSYRQGAASGRHEHAGLGLAIARAIVEAYDGTIVTRPRDGGGAVFEVGLPGAPSSPGPAVSGAPRPWRGAR